jgi:hypothetical protein
MCLIIRRVDLTLYIRFTMLYTIARHVRSRVNVHPHQLFHCEGDRGANGHLSSLLPPLLDILKRLSKSTSQHILQYLEKKGGGIFNLAGYYATGSGFETWWKLEFFPWSGVCH